MTEVRRDDEHLPRIERPQPELPEDWTELRKAKASAKTGWTYYRELVKLMHTELGEEQTAGLICKLMKGMAHRYFDASMEKFGIEGSDVWALASYFKLATGDVVGYKAELIQEGPKKVVYRLYPPCLWFPDLDIPPAFCLAEDCFEEEVARTHNPKVKVYCRSLLTWGDPYCETVFEETD